MVATNRDPRERPAVRKLVLLAKVQIDRRTQCRVRTDPHHVQELVEVLERKKGFKDDVELYFDASVYWVGDGFHRLEAYQAAGWVKIPALVREGGWLAAMIHAAGSNEDHGKRRTRDDLHRAITLLLEDGGIRKLSNRQIAKLARCDDKTVGALREKLGLAGDVRVYTDKHGNETEMNVSRLRRRGEPLTAGGRVNTFHDLPADAKDACKGLLRVLGRLTKEQHSFTLTWLSKLPPGKPKETEHLLAELEVEEGQGEDLDLGPDEGLKF
jgi:hypothetical protein